MDYAKDLRTRRIIHAEDASPQSVFICARPGCGGRVYLPDVRVQRPHFRHCPGEGTPACDLYFPGHSVAGQASTADPRADVEDDLSELGLLAEQVDDRWGLLLRLPELPSEEFGQASLAVLRSGFVEVFAGSDRVARVSALEVRPGIGAARVEVPPSLQPYRAQPTGQWPAGVSLDRWRQEARALTAVGTLFRLRGGEWARLQADSGVHAGEELVIVADVRCSPPRAAIIAKTGRLSSVGGQWSIWQVRIPEEPTADVEMWLARLGHSIVPRPWGIRLATPPRAFSEQGEPVLWLGDSAIFELEAPAPLGKSMATLVMKTNSKSRGIDLGPGRTGYLGVSSSAAAVARLIVTHERNASMDVAFEAHPDGAQLCRALEQRPRLRVWLGGTCMEAWRDQSRTIRASARDLSDIRLDTGVEGVRVDVTLFRQGKRRMYRQLAPTDAASVIASALPTASSLAVDAENLGRIEVHLLAHKERRADRPPSRLEWWEQVMGSVLLEGDHRSPVFSQRPGLPKVLRPQCLSAAGLVRARLADRARRLAESPTP